MPPPPRRPGGPYDPRKRQPAAGRNPQPRRRPKPPPPPIVYEDPPIRSSPPLMSGVIGAVGLIALVALVLVACQQFGGVKIPEGEGAAKLPQVNIAGAKPCVRSDSTRVNMNTEARVEACKQAKEYAKQKVVQEHGADGEKQFACLDELWVGESGWSAWAVNPSSGAWGIAQILPEAHPNPTVNGKPVGRTDWRSQVDWGLNYIRGRKDYGTPCKALELWKSRDPHWYRISVLRL